MATPLRLPNPTEQAVLNGLIVRPIMPSEQPRWDQWLTRRHYLKNARLVGEQRRYVGECEGQWLVWLGWSAPASQRGAGPRLGTSADPNRSWCRPPRDLVLESTRTRPEPAFRPRLAV